LATGGGKADGCIKIWNIYNENNQIKNVDTQSQISGLLWSDKNRELLSSHGYNQNNMIVWKYPSMEKLAELNGHSNRVLSVAMSANGEIVASLGADQTIRFWECFKVPQLKSPYSPAVSLGSLTHIQNIR
jgi:cell division cycle protein 20 (cofactor of APC complex)